MSAPDYNLKELIQNLSFKRWVQGEASEKEKKFWDQWIMQDPANRILAMRAQEEIEGFILRPADDTPVDIVWEHLRIGPDWNQKGRIRNVPSRNDLGKGGIIWLYRIAAGILLIVVCSFLITWFYQPVSEESAEIVKREVTTDYGERKTIKLSDGSKIVLNGHSGIVYTIDKNDPMAIDLFLEGEAYFSISKRKKPGDIPFRVRTDEGMVRVLGTQLVVSTRNNRTRVILEEGSVALDPFNINSETVLKPGQLGEFDNSSDSVKTRFVDLQLYTSWIKGQLHFERTPVHELADRLEETFGVKVVLRDLTLRSHRVSGSVESSELEVITSALSKMLDASIQKSETGKIIYIGTK